MDRRAKIVCTLGPASSDPDTIRALMKAGMDVVRLNFSHGTHEEHRLRIERVREAARELNRDIPILLDLQGPKIRLGLIEDDGIWVDPGDRIRLTGDDIGPGTKNRVQITYSKLGQDVDPGGRILLDDGLLEMEVINTEGDDVVAEVVVGGLLRSRKGVNLPNIRPSIPALTPKDLKDLEFGLAMDVEWIALSFVRSRDDVLDLRSRIARYEKSVRVLAKIEKPEAVDEIDGILDAVDGIMVARGDLGIEMPLSEVPLTQKRIIRKCLRAAKPVITATQMLESMIDNPRPTRAEASDVANAVLDGTDAVMLSGETAVGRYPIRVVEVMDRIVRATESHLGHGLAAREALPVSVEGPDAVMEGVSRTACQLARDVKARAIACLTHSGSTARAIARHRPEVPVFAFTDNERVVRELGVSWGTKAFAIPFQRNTDEGVAIVRRLLIESGMAAPGDRIVVTAGMPLPAKGRTNMLHVTRL